ARRLAYRLTPEGASDQVATWGLGARAFAAEVRLGVAEREAEIAHELGLPRTDGSGDEAGTERARAHGPALEPRVHPGPRALAASAADRSHPDPR
ncbi:MAG: DUF6167 family protein, partial [Actinomycetota bacterium]|nr:DUF6167 family protein [Actinomycetota bacterium]